MAAVLLLPTLYGLQNTHSAGNEAPELLALNIAEDASGKAAEGQSTLYHVSVPFTRLRLAVLAAMTAAMLFCLLVIPAFFDLPALNASSALILVTLLLACPTVMRFFRVIFDKRVAKLDLAPAKKQKKRHRFEK